MTPVTGSMTWDPKIRFTVDVTETAIPDESTTEVCDCARKLMVVDLFERQARINVRFRDQWGHRRWDYNTPVRASYPAINQIRDASSSMKYSHR